MKESKLEKASVKRAVELGWVSYKWSSVSQRGVPDRIFLKENLKIIFVEFKAPGKKPTKLQAHILSLLSKFGFKAYCIDNMEDFERVITC